MIGILDYGRGNVGSVRNACAFLEQPAELVATPEAAARCDGLIVPGQGHFGDCAASLRRAGFDTFLIDWAKEDRPLLGICVGLQLLFEGSEESPESAGLGLLPGVLRRFNPTSDRKVPQMGWNRLFHGPAAHPMLESVRDGSFFYFVHSFYAPVVSDGPAPGYTAATAEYGSRYLAAVARGNLWATQFHPEKSQRNGLQLLQNFFNLCTSNLTPDSSP